MSPLRVAMVIVSTAVLAISCGNKASTCTPELCSGCCDSVGQCQSGARQTACGSAGAVCKTCVSGQVCKAGACVAAIDAFDKCEGVTCAVHSDCDPADGKCKCGGIACLSTQECDVTTKTCVPKAGSCGATSCAGCCSNGTCLPGNFGSECGLNGKACTTCGAGTTCQFGVCSTGGPDGGSCNSANCGGCCAGGMCVSGTFDFQCGRFGQACLSCPVSSICIGGSCSGGGFDSGFCGPGNCFGCCAGNTCTPGNFPSLCGNGGQQCFSCPSGFNCNSGFCAPSCNSNNCAGCCDNNNQCQTGTSDQACGTKGVVCQFCFSGLQCVMGGCGLNPSDAGSCGPGNCNGCCSGGVCQIGVFDSQCGSNGQFCQMCPTSFACTGGPDGGNRFCNPIFVTDSGFVFDGGFPDGG